MKQLSNMKQHKGKIVEQAIKESGHQMKALAQKLGVARNTLYIRLQEEDLSDAFIIQVGRIIHYDFSIHFPDIMDEERYDPDDPASLYPSSGYRNPDAIQLQSLSKKYLELLEDYNKLLKLLILLANNNELVGIRKEITAFLEHEEQDG